MSELGVFAVDRGIFDHPLFRNERPYSRREAWLWLLSEASWKQRARDIAGRIVTLERGQLAHSVRFMAEAWGWSKSAVDRFLVRLEAETMIGTQSGTGLTITTVCNYDAYQRVSLPERDSNRDTARDSSGTAAGQTKDIQTIQEVTPLPPAGAKRARTIDQRYGDVTDPVFADFKANVWARRWKRAGHKPLPAFRAYARLADADRLACRDAIDRCARLILADASEERFRPMLASWINSRGWEAESPAEGPRIVEDEKRWQTRLTGARGKRMWSTPQWGPMPGMVGCRVPSELLIEGDGVGWIEWQEAA